MNKLNTAGTHVIDAQGKEWELETAHPMPLPSGLELAHPRLHFYGKKAGWGCYVTDDASHWMMRTDPPAPKTQKEMDEAWFTNWWSRNVESMIDASYARQAVHAALAHERGRKS